jgi:hypothetical protein
VVNLRGGVVIGMMIFAAIEAQGEQVLQQKRHVPNDRRAQPSAHAAIPV